MAYIIKKLDLDTVNWADIIPPPGCKSIGVKNSDNQDAKIRSDKNLASTEDVIYAGTQKTLLSNTSRGGVVVASLLAVSGVGPAILEFNS